LSANGIETLIHYPVPIPRQPALAGVEPGQCPVADRVCREVFSLPISPSLSDEDGASVARAVRAFQD
jgi:dTDP-3-amino-3,4,6-trideoxy-alpha-D-glucose transaminase